MNTDTTQTFSVGQLQVTVFGAMTPDAPVVYLHGMDGFARDVLPWLQQKGLRDFSLVTITVPSDLWSSILAPWSTPAGWPQYVACTEGAPQYLPVFLEKIVPQAEACLTKPGERILAGYSLGGLFALWVLFQTPMFTRIACASGSLWFPGFENWFFAHRIKKLPACIFFSCGEVEYDTDNEYLKAEKPALDAIHAWFQKQGVPTTLELDPGTHYQDVVKRTGLAIQWVLTH